MTTITVQCPTCPVCSPPMQSKRVDLPPTTTFTKKINPDSNKIIKQIQSGFTPPTFTKKINPDSNHAKRKIQSGSTHDVMGWLSKNIFNTSAAGGGIVNAPASKRFTKKVVDSHRTITKHLGGDLMQRDSGNKVFGLRRREFYCRNGKTLTHAVSFKETKKRINSCGPESWHSMLVKGLNSATLRSGDRDCCDQHDACYFGYDLKGISRIRNNIVSNKECENNFAACMGRQGSIQGRMLPTGVQMMSPDFYKPGPFKCE